MTSQCTGPTQINSAFIQLVFWTLEYFDKNGKVI